MLKSKEQKGFELFILDGEFAHFEDSENENIGFDNPDYAYELFKILNKASELGAFDKAKPEVSDKDIETIYV